MGGDKKKTNKAKQVHGIFIIIIYTRTVEKGLAKDEEIKIFVDANFLKDGQNGDGINGRNERGEHQAVRGLQRVKRTQPPLHIVVVGNADSSDPANRHQAQQRESFELFLFFEKIVKKRLVTLSRSAANRKRNTHVEKEGGRLL